MKIEDALEDLLAFKNESWDGMSEESLDMAIEALLLILNHKKFLKVLDRMKGDHIAQVTAMYIEKK